MTHKCSKAFKEHMFNCVQMNTKYYTLLNNSMTTCMSFQIVRTVIPTIKMTIRVMIHHQ